jgi:hypothetical protein
MIDRDGLLGLGFIPSQDGVLAAPTGCRISIRALRDGFFEVRLELSPGGGLRAVVSGVALRPYSPIQWPVPEGDPSIAPDRERPLR